MADQCLHSDTVAQQLASALQGSCSRALGRNVSLQRELWTNLVVAIHGHEYVNHAPADQARLSPIGHNVIFVRLELRLLAERPAMPFQARGKMLDDVAPVVSAGIDVELVLHFTRSQQSVH
jgi:hypothetical protein